MKLGHRGRARRRHARARPPSATPATSSIRSRTKYDLKYYVELAKELEKRGAHICSPSRTWPACASRWPRGQLVRALQQEVGMPIHFHTHDIAGGQMASAAAGGRGGRGHRRWRRRVDGRHDQPAEPERAGRSRCGSRRATPAWTPTPLQTTADYWEQGAALLRARSRSASWPPAPTSTATRCRAASTRTCFSRPRRWAWRRAGRRCAGRMPRSISSSATSSR